jgi:hypothetical protein
MMAYHDDNGQGIGVLQTPVRNHYFYGKLLDTRHFTLEQRYFNRKRWLLNRLVTGYGVVCGLDLVLNEELDHVIVLPGLAVDKWGREIVVPRSSRPILLERLPDAPECEEEWIHLRLAYHECESDPMPVLAAECDYTGPCAPDIVSEHYEILKRPGQAPEELYDECVLDDVVSAQGVRFEVLARWVSEGCSPPPDDPSIPLGDILIQEDNTSRPEDVHTEHRPIVYSNDLLYVLIVRLAEEVLQNRRRSNKMG